MVSSRKDWVQNRFEKAMLSPGDLIPGLYWECFHYVQYLRVETEDRGFDTWLAARTEFAISV